MLTTSQQWLLFFGTLLGFFGVSAGAFGAHFLKQKITEEMLSFFEIGVRYQMYHALATCLAVWMSTITGGVWALLGGWSFVIGTFIFSGSLYALAFTDVRAWGAVTPIGGLFFLLGWTLLAAGAFRSIG